MEAQERCYFLVELQQFLLPLSYFPLKSASSFLIQLLLLPFSAAFL